MFIIWGWEREALLPCICLGWGSSWSDAVIQNWKAWADLVSGAPFPDPSSDSWTCREGAKPYLFVWLILRVPHMTYFFWKNVAIHLDSKIILILYYSFLVCIFYGLALSIPPILDIQFIIKFCQFCLENIVLIANNSPIYHFYPDLLSWSCGDSCFLLGVVE